MLRSLCVYVRWQSYALLVRIALSPGLILSALGSDEDLNTVVRISGLAEPSKHIETDAWQIQVVRIAMW